MQEENRFKNYRKLLIIIFVATLFLSIGYAQIIAPDLKVEGTATAYEQSGVYVSGVSYSSSNYANVEESSTKQRVGSTVVSKIVLQNNQSANITYSITTTNSTENPYIYIGPAVSEHFYNNPDIAYEVTGINVGDIINPNGTATFNLTYSYSENASTYSQTNQLDAYINFGFREIFPITYSNIDGTGYPEYVINYKTSDNLPVELNVDFGTNAPDEIFITGAKTSTNYILGTDFTYQNGVLNFPNVSEPLNVAGPIPNDPPIISNLVEEQQITQGSVKLTYSGSDDLGIDHYEIETYQVVSGVDTLISTVSTNNTEYTVTGLQEGTYYFKVKVVDIYNLTDEATTSSKEYRWNLTATINITNGGPNGTTNITYGSAYSVTLTVNQGYSSINNMVVTMGGQTLDNTQYTFNQDNGQFSIATVTGDISITGRASTNVCLIEGTKILLANGKEKNVEDVKYDDLLLVWSYDEGRLVEEYPLWIEKGKKANEYTKITFSDNSEINIYYDHAFFSADVNKFVNVQDKESFHIGTKIIKLVNNKLETVEVTNIETINKEVNYYFVASTRYYNIVSDNFITTDAYTDITNLYPFDNNIKWDSNRKVEVLDYKYLENVLPYYMYKGFRAGEVAILLNNNKTDLNTFKDYIENIVLAEKMMKQPIKKNGIRYWPVSTSNKLTNKVLVKEGTYWILPNNTNIKYWYSTSEHKYYKPGDKVQVWTGMHFEGIK